MKLRKVISGGQTGADRTGLEEAKAMGLETGGMAPLHYRTEIGPDPSLKDFGLDEHYSYNYPPRTELNAKNADVTLWFGNIGSPGYWCTKNYAKKHGVDFVENPDAATILKLADNHAVWNVAGNRKSTNPKVVDLVRNAFSVLKEREDVHL